MTFIDDNIVPNPFVGGSGGAPFSGFPSNMNLSVRKIDAWVENRDHSWKVLRGIRLYWFEIELPSAVFGRNEGEIKTLELIRGERITRLALYGDERVDRIEIFTDRGNEWKAGGLGGEQVILDVGSGFLLGFDGAAGIDVDRLRPRMMKFYRTFPTVILTNRAVGGSFGSPFWACRADHTQVVVQSLDIWTGAYSWETGWTTVIRAIQITWSDQTLSRCYGALDHRGLRHDRFSFKLDADGTIEKVTEFTIWGADRTDRIQFRTDRGSVFSAGGNGGASGSKEPGSPGTIQCGSGILVGFHGACGTDIDRLGPIFLR